MRVPRAILIYLTAVVAPALVLLYLGVQTLRRQHESVRALVEANRRLEAEKLATAVHKQMKTLAAACLVGGKAGPGPLCLGAREFFRFEDGMLRYPLVNTPPPVTVAGLPPSFMAAEELELRRGDLPQAIEAYRRSVKEATTSAARALAASRVARCLARMNQPEAARQAWRKVLSDYPDIRDPSHRPYALVAQLELGEREAAWRDLIRNRWELSAEQFDYFLARIGRSAPARNRYEFARTAEEHFRHFGSLRNGEIYSQAWPGCRVYYQSADEGRQILGMAVDEEWVAATLIPQVRHRLGLQPLPEPILRQSQWTFAGGVLLVLALLVTGVVFVFRDVNRELRANRLRQDFVSGVSHELKTPLTLIRLYAETLLHGRSFSEGDRRDFYGIITRESERLSHLIEKVLTFSRIDRGQEQYTLEAGSLTQVVSRTVAAYRQFLVTSGFNVETSLAADLPEVRFDADAVSQAVVNLLDNAVKYSGESKFIGVRLHAAGRQVVFEVEDHGCGIAPEHRARIFDRFYRLPNRPATGGYGLGLFLVRHIMEAHAGAVEVDSEPERGSRFKLVFPVAS